jgi:cold shock CspA family protein
MTGSVKYFNNDGGYGYITGDGGGEFYVHYTEIKKRPQRLTAGQRVSFIDAGADAPCEHRQAHEVAILG